MKLNLTKLLNLPKNLYVGRYGETSWVGDLNEGKTNVESAYMFTFEEEEEKTKCIQTTVIITGSFRLRDV